MREKWIAHCTTNVVPTVILEGEDYSSKVTINAMPPSCRHRRRLSASTACYGAHTWPTLRA